MLAAALLWARANPKAIAWIFALLAVLIAGAMAYRWAYGRGAEGVWGRVDQQNKEAHRAATEAGSRVDDCYGRDGMRWDYPRGECVRSEGPAR